MMDTHGLLGNDGRGRGSGSGAGGLHGRLLLRGLDRGGHFGGGREKESQWRELQYVDGRESASKGRCGGLIGGAVKVTMVTMLLERGF